jgi:hypothetical protein
MINKSKKVSLLTRDEGSPKRPLTMNKLLFLAEEQPNFSEEMDYNTQTTSNIFFNPHAGTRTIIEKYEGEAYMFTIKKKLEEKFSSIDKLLGEQGGFKMDNKFKTDVKNIVTEIHGIVRRNPKYSRHLKKTDDDSQSLHLNLKYLFLSVVYLKLKSDLFQNIGDSVLEVGINDLVGVYGQNEICLGRLGNYLEFVKAVAKDYGLGLELDINEEDKRSLAQFYLNFFLKIADKLIKSNPNYANYNEKKMKRVFFKIYDEFEGRIDCMRSKRIRHLCCAIFHISLRVLDVNTTLLELIEILKEEQMFNKMMYHSVTRIRREICSEIFGKFKILLEEFKQNKQKLTIKLGKLSWFLKVYSSKQHELSNLKRMNIKCPLVLEIVKFMLKKKVIKIFSEIGDNFDFELGRGKKRLKLGDDSELATTADMKIKDEDRCSTFSGLSLKF